MEPLGSANFVPKLSLIAEKDGVSQTPNLGSVAIADANDPASLVFLGDELQVT